MRAEQNMQIHNYFKKCEMDPPYNVHLTQNSVQCKTQTKIVPHSANRGPGVVFLIASGFLQEKNRCSNDEGGR